MEKNYTPESDDNDRTHHPISLYMMLVVDLILIGTVIYFASKAIF